MPFLTGLWDFLNLICIHSVLQIVVHPENSTFNKLDMNFTLKPVIYFRLKYGVGK